MIGYILLILATLSGNAKELAAKQSSRALDTLNSKLYFGAVRTGICALLSLLIWLWEGQLNGIGIKGLGIAVLSGISQSMCMLAYISAARGGAYVRLNIFNHAGMVIPCVFAAPLLGESISVWQCIALGVLIWAVPLLDGNKAKAERIKASDLLLLLLVWLTSGLNSLTIKLFVKAGEGTNCFFNLITFTVAAIAFFGSYLIFRKKEDRVSLPRSHYTVYIPTMVASLYLYTFLQAEAANYLDSMIMFPLKTVVGLFVSALIAVVFLKEKLTSKNILGIVMVTGAMIVINTF